MQAPNRKRSRYFCLTYYKDIFQEQRISSHLKCLSTTVMSSTHMFQQNRWVSAGFSLMLILSNTSII